MKESNQFNNAVIGVLGIGYIGSNILNYFKELNNSNVEVVALNRMNYQLIEEKTFDYFINCAGNSGDFRNNLYHTLESNINLHIYLLKHLKVRKTFLTLSSTRIYGFTENPLVYFDELYETAFDHLNIDYIYNGSKRLNECILFNSSDKVDYKIKIVRLSNVYGKFNQLDDSTIIKKIIRLKKNNDFLKIDFNKNSTKDYIYIDDAISGILKVLDCPEKLGVYNIASGKSHSVDDICEIIKLPIINNCNQQNEIHSRVSIAKAQNKLGFYPKVSMESGLIKTITNA